MCTKMLDDLNVILLNVTNLKQELLIYHAMADEPDPATCLYPHGVIKLIVIDLHKLLSFSYADYHTIWNFWNRMENSYYHTRPFPPETINRWREELLVWRNEMAVLKDLRDRYVTDMYAVAGAPGRSLNLLQIGDMARRLEAIVLEMLGPVVGAQLSSLEAGRPHG